MKRPALNAKTVVLIMAALVLLVIAVAIVGFGLFRRGLVIETSLDETVPGLDVGSSLYFRGVRIGWVTDIALVED
jgi:ABC-type transporter Mla subunit MlaD